MLRRAYQPHETPGDALHGYLQDWEEEFFQYWRATPPGPDAAYPDIEEAREVEALIDRLRTLCERAPAVYRTMLRQEVDPRLEAALRDFAEVPLRVDGFDARRLSLVPSNELVWHHIDLALIRDAMTQVQQKPLADRRKVYELLIVTAVEQRISHIAAWYFERAARLLLYGLDVECTAMCRAVLEAALRFRIVDSELESVGIERKGWNPEEKRADFDLAGRIEGAKRLRLWSRDEKDRATLIRKLGNDVLHPDDPEKFERMTSEIDASRRIADLAILLRRLFPAG